MVRRKVITSLPNDESLQIPDVAPEDTTISNHSFEYRGFPSFRGQLPSPPPPKPSSIVKQKSPILEEPGLCCFSCPGPPYLWFPTRTHLSHHLITAHTGTRIRCEHCLAVIPLHPQTFNLFTSPYSYLVHLLTHPDSLASQTASDIETAILGIGDELLGNSATRPDVLGAYRDNRLKWLEVQRAILLKEAEGVKEKMGRLGSSPFEPKLLLLQQRRNRLLIKAEGKREEAEKFVKGFIGWNFPEKGSV